MRQYRGRLTEPPLRDNGTLRPGTLRPGTLRPASWDEALDFAAAGLSRAREPQIVKVTSPADHDITRGNLCIKGRFGVQHVKPKPRPADTA